MTMWEGAAGCQRKTRTADPHAFAAVAGGVKFLGKIQAPNIVAEKKRLV